MTRPHTDQPARDRIRTDLATNMLVEAGAGSGKTTSLVERLLEHVRTGTPVERLAAVTFTRKAANELRERFQVRLEQAVREADAGSGDAARCERALRELDRAFLGTIHAFCGRLLRERPLEVALDPNFTEVAEEDWEELKQHFWRRWLERAKRTDDPGVRALQRVGIDPQELYAGFALVMTYPDVAFALDDVAAPDVAPCRRELERLLAEARRLMPRDEPEGGWDDLMRLVRRLEFRRSVHDWSDVASFCDALASVSASHCKLVQKRWSDTAPGRAEAKALGESFATLLDGGMADVLRCWREHRYPLVMRVLQRAAADFARERHATGQLGFEDLLLLTATLLREHPAVRDELGARYAHLLVDEFQDTDPIQAEVCFLLASDSAGGSDWRTVTPRPGSLFVVGDPKQSIYRFRRADIQVYEFVKRRLHACGAVLALTSNFRSVSAVEAVVNGHFADVFPAEATAEQAPYRPMETVRDPEGADAVYRYTVRPDGRSKGDVLERDAAMVASWIAARIAAGERTAGDFLVLTATKAPIERYARALAERNVPVTTTGARLPQEHELNELLVVLRAIADPENAVLVVAALEGLFFGLSPADLWAAAHHGLRFALTHPPADAAHHVGRALAQLHEWWKLSQRHPADVLLERILSDTGLLFHAAGQALGDARAGALLHLVEALRATSGADRGITDAMSRLEVLLAAEAADAPLRPGRTDAVRVMNLHKAKGLEGEVVILAAPLDETPRDPIVHVTRAESGESAGGLCIGYRSGRTHVVLAHPTGWAGMQAAERRFAEAERARLLYVAATRARRQLVVAQAEKPLARGVKPDASMWRPLAPVLDEHALQLAMPETEPAGRRRVERSPASLREAVLAAAARIEAAAASSLHVRTVTESAKEAAPEPAGGRTKAASAGAAWGRAVHRAVEALGRGRRGASLAAFARAVARDEGLPAGRDAELVALLDAVEASDGWRRLAAAGTPQVELGVMRRTTEGGRDVLLEGVIDAAALGVDGWEIVDWKSDAVDDAAWAQRRGQYERQVEAYAALLADLTGVAARGTIERVRISPSS